MKGLHIILITIAFFLSGCTLPSFKSPDFFGVKPPTQQGTNNSAVPSDPSKSLEKLTGVEQQIKELRLKLEADYSKFKQEIQQAYDSQKKINLDNLETVSHVNYGIVYVTEQEKDSDMTALIANLRAKQNMARLPLLTNEDKVKVEAEVNEEKQKTYAELVVKYNALVAQSESVLKLLDNATKAVEQKEKERQTLIEEFKAKLGVLESAKDEQYKVLQNDIEGKIKNAREDQRLEMIGLIVKPLAGIGVLLLVAGLLMKSPTFIIAGLTCGGIAYVAASVPFWVVISGILILLGVMIFVDPRTGKMPIMSSFTFGKGLFKNNVSSD